MGKSNAPIDWQAHAVNTATNYGASTHLVRASGSRTHCGRRYYDVESEGGLQWRAGPAEPTCACCWYRWMVRNEEPSDE